MGGAGGCARRPVTRPGCRRPRRGASERAPRGALPFLPGPLGRHVPREAAPRDPGGAQHQRRGSLRACIYERELAETLGVQVDRPSRQASASSSRTTGRRTSTRCARTSPWRSAAAPAPDGARRSWAAGKRPGTFIVPIGPQHPALKEPGHFELDRGRGDRHACRASAWATCTAGIEKGAEDRSWVHNIYLMERICGICSHIHATAYVLGVEKLAGVAVPPRAQAIRTIFARWSGSTATCCGSAWPRTRRASTRCSCTAGGTGRRSWTCWRSSRETG